MRSSRQRRRRKRLGTFYKVPKLTTKTQQVTEEDEVRALLDEGVMLQERVKIQRGQRNVQHTVVFLYLCRKSRMAVETRSMSERETRP